MTDSFRDFFVQILVLYGMFPFFVEILVNELKAELTVACPLRMKDAKVVASLQFVTSPHIRSHDRSV